MGFENDKLDRERYANFLTEMVQNPEKYKRISDSESLSIAIDASWGSGKTTFLKMWKEKLGEELNDNIIISYNAWKNDFAEDPLESLVYTIVNHESFNKEGKGKKSGIELLKVAGKITRSVGSMFVSSKFGNGVGDLVEKILSDDNIESVKDYLENTKTKSFYKEYKEYLDAVNEFKTTLGKISSENKIIIMIDELDRCKPLFAIRLLERVKHIFDVPNISFVFALDMEQLSYSIKCVYGQEMDASGYLCRFFDYITKMPKPDTYKYITYLVESKPLIRKNISYYNEKRQRNENVAFVDILYDFSKNLNLSLRDINTVYANFIILEQKELNEVDCMQAYALYLMLIILKYKYTITFNKIFIDNNFEVNDKTILQHYQYETYYFNTKTLSVIMERQAIKEISFNVRNRYEIYYGTKIMSTERNILKCENSGGVINGVPLDSMLNISDCLFYDDMKNWDEVKEKSLVQYIHEKLEFFNFEWENKNQENKKE